MTINSTVFSERLREAMRRKRISQQRLGHLLGGLHRSTVARWLQRDEHSIPSAWHVVNMARILDVSVRWLTGGRDTPEPPVFLDAGQRRWLGLYNDMNPTERESATTLLEESAAALSRHRLGCHGS